MNLKIDMLGKKVKIKTQFEEKTFIETVNVDAIILKNGNYYIATLDGNEIVDLIAVEDIVD